MKFKFSYLMLLMALTVAATAGYFSVWGLSQLFAGASFAVIIMATVLEIAKVVTTTILHKHWSKLAIGLKTYLTIGVIVLMLITSAGIYGYLSNAYQSTANRLEIHEGELSVLDGKKGLFEKNTLDNEKIISTKNKRIDQLTNLRSNQETRLDSAKTNRTKDKVRNDILIATNEIQKLSNDIDVLNIKNSVLSDSISKYNSKGLELKAGSSVAGEVGPLKYISKLTGTPMDVVVNYLILLLIFVFDPLAIALILATNRVFELESGNGDTKTTIKEPINEPLIQIPVSEKIINNTESSFVTTEPPSQIVTQKEEPVINTDLNIVLDNKHVVSHNIMPEIEPTVNIIEEPVITTKKIELEDIKEIKENRGYSVPIPKANNNTIERIGSNKVIKDGDTNKFFFKRK